MALCCSSRIPDFYWAFIYHLAIDSIAAARQFVVECKRLTLPSKNWMYTEQYVQAGISRFVTVEHAYGKEVPSGAMVGYLQVIALDQAMSEVNSCAVAEKLAPLHLSDRGTKRRAELDHQLERGFPDSPFRLIHLWIRA